MHCLMATEKTGCGLRVARYELRVAGCGLRVGSKIKNQEPRAKTLLEQAILVGIWCLEFGPPTLKLRRVNTWCLVLGIWCLEFCTSLI
jgi:hypothetical protein